MSIEEPQTIEEIAQDYDLPVEAVREAIAYCESNPPEIRDDFAREEALMSALGLNDPHAAERMLAPQEMAQIDRSP
jgi:hypothetical protein